MKNEQQLSQHVSPESAAPEAALVVTWHLLCLNYDCNSSLERINKTKNRLARNRSRTLATRLTYSCKGLSLCGFTWYCIHVVSQVSKGRVYMRFVSWGPCNLVNHILCTAVLRRIRRSRNFLHIYLNNNTCPLFLSYRDISSTLTGINYFMFSYFFCLHIFFRLLLLRRTVCWKGIVVLSYNTTDERMAVVKTPCKAPNLNCVFFFVV
jgi:hypothetical protein